MRGDYIVVASSVGCIDRDGRECFMSAGEKLVVLCPVPSSPDLWVCAFCGETPDGDFAAEIPGEVLRNPAWFSKDPNGTEWLDALDVLVEPIRSCGYLEVGGTCRMEH